MPTRILRLLALVLAIGFVSGPARAASDLLPMPELTDSGLHSHPWFHQSFLNLPDDLADATAEGKRLVIFWEQRGCPYCKRMNEVNLRLPRVVDYIQKNFMVIQLNLWGDREVIDFDGEVTTEKKLAEKYQVIYTPTLSFFPETVEEMKGKPAPKDREVNRVTGYFKPFHFYFLFRYAKTRGYETEPNFQRWLGDVGQDLQEKNIKYDLWDDFLPADMPTKYFE